MKKQSNYINRELSWMQFNARVLEEACCESNPLLERIKFLAITASNLDEFVAVRVGSLILIAQSGSNSTSIDGLSAEEQLALLRQEIQQFNSAQNRCLSDLIDQLSEHGIKRLSADELDTNQLDYLENVFSQTILSTITPKAIIERQILDGTSNQFAHLTGTRLSICIKIKNQTNAMLDCIANDEKPASRYVTVSLGSTLPRLVTVPGEGYPYILLEDLIELFLEQLLPDEVVEEVATFRITRNADVTVDDDEIADLLSGMQEMIQARQLTPCVRFEISSWASDEMLEFLTSKIGVHDDDIYKIDGPMDLSFLFGLASIKGYKNLRDESWPAQKSPDFPADKCIFEVISTADRILYHPYQEYEPVVEFIKQAAIDPDVIAIKQTLYRTSRNSEIVRALIEAANNGKHVTVIVELKARFDEARNIHWARQMELAGVDVIYGVQGLKTHAKVCIVVRKETSGMHRYLHFGTGNYNEATSRIYSDVSYFTRDEQLGIDAIHFFNCISGLSVPQSLGKISAAPINLRETFLDLIRFETENAQGVIGAEIAAKLNSLVDKQIIDALYGASKAGVKINLNVRGICCLRPGVKGLSENITVVSIVDRFLEHARLFRFKHNGENRMLMASADWMNRNLDRRVELLVPVDEQDCKARLTLILDSYFKDNVKSRELQNDGSYQFVPRSKHELPFRAQRFLYENACELFAAHNNPRTTIFKPHRGESA